jgi:hypothetical protein
LPSSTSQRLNAVDGLLAVAANVAGFLSPRDFAPFTATARRIDIFIGID